MISIRCPHCSVELRVKDALAGKTGNCPGCHKPIQIPPILSTVISPAMPATVLAAASAATSDETAKTRDPELADGTNSQFEQLDDPLQAFLQGNRSSSPPIVDNQTTESLNRERAVSIDIDLIKPFALSAKSARVPSRLILSTHDLRVESAALPNVIEVSRPPRRGQVRFVLGMNPVELPKQRRFRVKILSRTFEVERPAADALCAWLPVTRPWIATALGVNLLLGMVIVQVIGGLLLLLLMADGRIAAGIPLGPVIFGIGLFRASAWKKKYDELERLRKIRDPMIAVLQKAGIWS